MNNHYRKMEAYAIRNAFMTYFNTDPDSTGIIAGIQSDVATGRLINYTRVSLQSGNRLYIGDRYNNGFYMFDRLPPGLYTVRFETPGFHMDSVQVTVVPGGRHFADRSLVSFAAPTVIASSPVEGDTSVAPDLPVSIAFSKPMDITSVANAFSVTPPVTSSFSWTRGNSELTFSPDSVLPFYTDIMIVLDTSARSATGEQIDGNGDGTPGDPYILQFRTGYVDAVPPSLVSVRPAPDETRPTPGDVLNFTFNEPLDQATVNVNNFVLRASTGALQLRTGEYVEAAGKGGVSLWLPYGTEPGATYTIRLSNIADTAGNTIPGNTEWEFSIHPDPVTTRSIDSLTSSVDEWEDPFSSPYTTGVDSARFALSALRRFPPGYGSGESALLSYAWDTTAAEWLLHLGLDSSRANLVRWGAGGSVLQTYVHGDGSGTLLRFVLDDSLDASPGGTPSGMEVSPWMIVDWVGWRLLEWDHQNDSTGSWVGDGKLDGEIRLNGIQLGYAPGSGMPGGEIGIAAVQVAERIVTGVKTPASVPLSYTVHQNYPNPFNPTTRIAYELPRETWVSLVVYDILGRRVATLVDQMQPAGFHDVEWHGTDGNGLPVTSGLYIGRFEAKDAAGGIQHVQVNKMLFVK
ncbi:MAG: Ig-like domain-containing protein [Bacteroidota bacterium]